MAYLWKAESLLAQVGSIASVGPYDGILAYGINANLFNGQTLGSINGTNAPNPFLQPFTVKEKELALS